MSAFSEEIRQEIKKSGKTLLYLSEISGLSLDHISKMRMGKRLPQDEKKIKTLIGALECSARTGRHLFSLYKMEKMGKTEWDCIEELKNLLGTWKYPVQKAVLPFPVLPEMMRREGPAVLNSRSEICAFLMSAMAGEQYFEGGKPPTLYMMTGEMPPELVNVLSAAGEQKRWVCVHWFSLLRNTEPEAALYNLRAVNRLLPLLQKEGQYMPYFDYGEKRIQPDMNWIAGEQWALGLDEGMESGFVLRDEAQVEYLRNHIRTKCQNGRELLERNQEDTASMKEAWLSGTKEKKVYGLSAFPYPVVWSRKEMEITCFFTGEGLRRFLEGEDIPMPVRQDDLPFLREQRKAQAEQYLARMEKGEEPCRLLDSMQLSLAPGLFWYLESSGTGCSPCVVFSEYTGGSWTINEMGISERIRRLMEFMEEGELLLSRQEGIREIKRQLQEISV